MLLPKKILYLKIEYINKKERVSQRTLQKNCFLVKKKRKALTSQSSFQKKGIDTHL